MSKCLLGLHHDQWMQLYFQCSRIDSIQLGWLSWKRFRPTVQASMSFFAIPASCNTKKCNSLVFFQERDRHTFYCFNKEHHTPEMLCKHSNVSGPMRLFVYKTMSVYLLDFGQSSSPRQSHLMSQYVQTHIPTIIHHNMS